MSRLEQFIRDHRESFDSEAPPKRVWDQVKQQTGDGQNKIEPVIWLTPGRWAVAVALSLLVAGGTWYLAHRTPDSNHPGPAVAGDHPALAISTVPRTQTDGSRPGAEKTATAPTAQMGSALQPGHDEQAGQGDPAAEAARPDPDPDAFYREKMGYYTKLVRIRHKELGTIEKDEPLLYQQFSGDVKKLDSVYRDLEKQLPDNPNHEQLLQAMLEALQLQMKLLNHQLGIIQQINHSKKTAYEKAFKTT
jgi:hypothetical protein